MTFHSDENIPYRIGIDRVPIMVYRRYAVIGDSYGLELMNPFSKKTKEVYVRDYLYYNTYFVGDTIK